MGSPLFGAVKLLVNSQPRILNTGNLAKGGRRVKAGGVALHRNGSIAESWRTRQDHNLLFAVVRHQSAK